MGVEYALVHCFYTIPPAIALSYLYRPLATWIDVYKVLFLITIAVVSTIPWDSYLIRTRIWTYPENVIVGPKLCDIPAEEVFFFVIQTFNTSLLYLLLSKPTLHALYLRAEGNPRSTDSSLKVSKWMGQIFLSVSIAWAIQTIRSGGTGTYFGLIVAWAFPFLLLLWSLAYQLLIGLPLSNTLLPIALPTLYLWMVDTLALQRGTWVIEEGTKLGIHVWPHLEIEEAFFFLATNTLIVFGMVAFDNALAIMYTFTPKDVIIPEWPSPLWLVKALLRPASTYDAERIDSLRQAVEILRRKSRSFFIASGAFQGRLRHDLVILYAFCRVADDLVDESTSSEEARIRCEILDAFLGVAYNIGATELQRRAFVAAAYAEQPKIQMALNMLPTKYLTRKPLQELIEGFRMDLGFKSADGKDICYPIDTEETLDLYASRVAGTVAQSCLELVFANVTNSLDEASRKRVEEAGARMGIALQYVNMSRDIAVDARMSRVYVPTTWLKDEGLTPLNVLQGLTAPAIENLRTRLLDRAFLFYEGSRTAIEELPVQARGPMRVAVESYMEIGRVLRERKYPVKHGRATVPKLRRIRVAWKALRGPRWSPSSHPLST